MRSSWVFQDIVILTLFRVQQGERNNLMCYRAMFHWIHMLLTPVMICKKYVWSRYMTICEWDSGELVTYSVASWVMLLKVNGASVLMLLLLRSLCIFRHIQANTHTRRTYHICACYLSKQGHCNVCIFCLRLCERYAHQWQLLQACELLGHRCQHVTLQVPVEWSNETHGVRFTNYYCLL